MNLCIYMDFLNKTAQNFAGSPFNGIVFDKG